MSEPELRGHLSWLYQTRLCRLGAGRRGRGAAGPAGLPARVATADAGPPALGVYAAGDWRDTPSIQGALVSGRRVADAVARPWGRAGTPAPRAGTRLVEDPNHRPAASPGECHQAGVRPVGAGRISIETKGVPPVTDQPDQPPSTAAAAPPGRDASLALPVAQKAGWSEVDVRAVDTVRVLAADAVQKVGNGHPGTAMSLAPVAYLLFHQVMRHDPNDDQWLGRDRFVLSCGHSSLTLYIQLYFSGYGLELPDLEALRTWGSKTPGHPEYRHTRGVEITTGPLGQGLAHAVGMAWGARRERGLLDPEAEPGDSPFDHHVYVLASDGDLMEGVTSEASSLAGHQELGNLVADLRPEPHLDRGRHRHLVQRERRPALRRLRLAHPDHRLADAQRLRRGRRRAAGRHRGGQGRDPAALDHRPQHDHRVARADQAEHRQGPRLGARRRGGRGHQAAARLRPGPDVRGRGRRAGPRPRGQGPRRPAARGLAAALRAVAGRQPRAGRAAGPPAGAGAARRLGRRHPDLRPRPQGHRDAGGQRQGADRAGAGAARALGRLGRPGREQQHDDGRRAELGPDRPPDQGLDRRTVRPDHALRHPRARDGRDPRRHLAAVAHPRVRRDVPVLQRLHATGRPDRRVDEAAGDLRLDARLDRPGRGRPDPPAGRAPGRAPRDPRAGRRPARPTPTRRRSPGARSCSTTTGRPA